MENIKGFIFDLDGTVYVGDQLINGANEILSLIRQSKKQVLFLSNGTYDSPQEKVVKLHNMGIETKLEEILDATTVLVRYLKKQNKPVRVFPIGSQQFIEYIKSNGIEVTDQPGDIDFVVISCDRDFNFEKLNIGFQAVMQGAMMVATNPDRTCPVKGGVLPDTGAIIGAFEGATGQKIETIAGKPFKLMVDEARSIINLKPEECMIIGDRLDTDILMGKKAGMKTALVLTGVQNDRKIVGDIKPDYVFDSIIDLKKYFSGINLVDSKL